MLHASTALTPDQRNKGDKMKMGLGGIINGAINAATAAAQIDLGYDTLKFQKNKWDDQTNFRNMAYEDQKAFRDMSYEDQKEFRDMAYGDQTAFRDKQYADQTAFRDDVFQYNKDQNALAQEREDNAAQRRAADLEAAGINPLLAAGSPAQAGSMSAGNVPSTGGSSVSAPGISSAGINTPGVSGGLDASSLMAGISNMGNVMNSMVDIKMKEKTIDNIEADTANKNSQNPVYEKQIEKLDAEINKIKSDKSLTDEQKKGQIVNNLKNSIVEMGDINVAGKLFGVGGEITMEQKETIYDIADKLNKGQITSQTATEMMKDVLSHKKNIEDEFKQLKGQLEEKMPKKKK